MHDILPDALNQRAAFFGDFHHDFPAVVGGVGALDVVDFLQAVDQSGGGGGGMVHLVRNLTHGESVILRTDVAEQKKLRKGNLAPRQFLGQPEHETTLQRQDDICQTFHIGPRCWFVQFNHRFY